MRFIAHRGNTIGPNCLLENSLDYIDLALDQGYDVEVDIWKIGSKFFLGHDMPEYPVDINWIFERDLRLWLHAKNFEALDSLIQKVTPNVFWHEDDCYAMTSKGQLWSFPEVYDKGVVYAWCSDYVASLQKPHETKN